MERTKIGRETPSSFKNPFPFLLLCNLQSLIFFRSKVTSVYVANSCSYCPVLYLPLLILLYINVAWTSLPKRVGLLATKPNAEYVTSCKHVELKLFVYLCMHDINFCFAFFNLPVLKAFTLSNWYLAVKLSLA